MHWIYNKYPSMRPYVGVEPGRPPLFLLVGESHYLPKESTQHLSAERWYASDESTLSPRERQQINTAAVLKKARDNGFTNPAHSIFRKSFTEINKAGPKNSVCGDVGDIIVFCNYFLRPGREGKSIRPVENDEHVANEVFWSIFGEYQPRAVVFLSQLAYQSWAKRPRASEIAVPVINTPHPGCRYWNCPCKTYGGKRGRELLAEFVRLHWSAVSS